jgi:outer membrane protein OmpA-like peptidoglycan-associated protein
MKTSHPWIALSLLLAAPTTALADVPAPTGNWLFFGATGGIARVSQTTFPEREKDGSLLGVKFLASRYSPDWVYDAGFGFFHSFVRSDIAGVANFGVTTNAGFLELGARHMLTPRIHAGLLAHLWVGTDVSFSQATNDAPIAGLIGAKIQYEFPAASYFVRIGANFMTDVTISDRQLFFGLLNVEFGLPLGARESAPVASSAPVSVVEPSSGPAVVDGQTVRVSLGETLLRFEYDSARIAAESEVALAKMGALLSARPGDWEKIRIDGHTDARGSGEYNVDLSFKRSVAVAKVLIAHGVPSDRVETRGIGPKEPLDKGTTEEAHAANRRVELRIVATQDTTDELRDSLNQIWQ